MFSVAALGETFSTWVVYLCIKLGTWEQEKKHTYLAKYTVLISHLAVLGKHPGNPTRFLVAHEKAD